MALRIGYSWPNSGGFFPANQGLREHSLRNSTIENSDAKVGIHGMGVSKFDLKCRCRTERSRPCCRPKFTHGWDLARHAQKRELCHFHL